MICWNFCSGVLLSPWPRTPGLHLNFMTSSESTDSKKNEDEEKTGKMRLNKVPAKEIFFSTSLNTQLISSIFICTFLCVGF